MLIEDDRTRKRRVYDWWSRYPRLLDVLYIVAFLGREDAFRRRAIETLDLTPGERVLEVGCGNGNSFASLRDSVSSGGTIVGLDVSRGTVRSARDRTLNGKHRNLHLVRGDARRLPFPPGTFDTSYASMSLSAVPDPKRTIDAVETVLRPGGRFVVLDAQPFQQYASKELPESAAIIGGGYVSVEMAEAFSAHDLDVHLFQRPDRLLPPFGDAIEERVAETLRENDITVHQGTEVNGLVGTSHVEAVSTNVEQFSVDPALIGIGIRPNTELVVETDIELGESGAIAVDEFGRTNDDAVYAAGDCAEMRHAVTGEPD